jgi:hypothetical protein
MAFPLKQENRLWYYILFLVSIPAATGSLQLTLYYQSLIQNETLIKAMTNAAGPQMVRFQEHEKPLFYQYLNAPILAFWMHIIPSFLWGLTVLIQFSPYIRKQWTALHRFSGYVMAFLSCLMISGVFGLALKNLIYTVQLFHWSIFTAILFNYTVGSWFIFTLFMGIKSILKKDVKRHRVWMIRHCLTGLSVGLQRVFVAIISLFFQNITPVVNHYYGKQLLWTDEDLATDERKKVFFGYCLWISFLINLGLSESVLSATSKKNKSD